MSSPPAYAPTTTGTRNDAPQARRTGGVDRSPRAETNGKTAALSPAELAKTAPIICVCHLSWHWVWQRPQQFLSRLAKRHPVLFVETYCTDTITSYFELQLAEKQPNVTLLRIHLPAARWQDGAFIDAERRRILKKVLSDELEGCFDDAVLWMYDPMAVTAFAGQLKESLIVYDCMDELSQFKGAPPELIARERELLRLADVVFCGGQKMRRKRLEFNRNCHFYGTGVDCDHFGRARSRIQPIDPQIAALPKPVLGYFGVIDERIDYELLAKIADARPDWSIAMVGPTTKVDQNELPKRPNLHWIGPRPYSDLPAITKGFSVCLMPFALNAATEYINPTKALEYMAAGKPVVSTALDEVRMNFGSVAHIAPSHESFLALCAGQISSPSRLRIARGLSLASNNTWEAIAAKMEDHMADALVTRQNALKRQNSSTLSVPATNLAYV